MFSENFQKIFFRPGDHTPTFFMAYIFMAPPINYSFLFKTYL